MTNISCFQCLKCKDLLFFFVFEDFKHFNVRTGVILVVEDIFKLSTLKTGFCQ